MSGSVRVVVVGGGLAGLTATIEAARNGAMVTLIEKEPNLGGNAAKATSGMNGVGTEAQKVQGVDDNLATFIKDTMESGRGLSTPELVEVLGQNSAEAHKWLASLGLNLCDLVQLGGHSERRTHRFPPTADGKPVPVGFTLTSSLRKEVEGALKDSVTVITQAKFKCLVKDGERVIGLRYTDMSESGSGSEHEILGTVVLASGGYANDHTDTSLLVKHCPDLAKLPTTNGPWATGDIIRNTGDDGLSLVHMDKVQVHPTGFIEPKQPNFHTKFLAPEALRGCGGILLDVSGKRFVNELGRRDYVTEKVFEHGTPFQGKPDNPKVAAMLLSQAVIDKFGPASVGFYKFKGLIEDIGSLDITATKLGIKPAALAETLKQYRADSEAGKDQFSKNVFPVVFTNDDHFYIAYITPTLHYCMGGIEITKDTNVLRKDHTIVPGLFAAGEVSGGVHGANRLGGNSLLECVVYGRVAGRNAALSST